MSSATSAAAAEPEPCCSGCAPGTCLAISLLLSGSNGSAAALEGELDDEEEEEDDEEEDDEEEEAAAAARGCLSLSVMRSESAGCASRATKPWYRKSCALGRSP